MIVISYPKPCFAEVSTSFLTAKEMSSHKINIKSDMQIYDKKRQAVTPAITFNYH